MSKKNIIILLVVITLIGAFLRIFPVRYDSVRMYDIQLVTEAFDLGDGIVKGDFSVFKTPVKYPFFFPYVLVFFYGIFYIIGKLAGLFSSAGEFINYIFFHLDNFYDFARVLIGIFGTALIPLVYIVTSKIVALKNKKRALVAGLLAAFLMAFNLLHIHLSHEERPHILVSFFIFLSFYFFILVLEKKSLFRFLLLGLGVGLAASSLQTGLIALIFFVLIVLFNKFRCLTSIRFWLGALVFLMIFAFCYPYIILVFNQSAYSTSTGRIDITFSGGKHGWVDFSGQGFRTIANGFLFYDPSLVLLFILFLFIYLFGNIDGSTKGFKLKGKLNHFSEVIIGGISVIILYVCFWGIYNNEQFRILAPLIPFLCFFVGILFSEIFSKFKKRYFKIVFIGILILFLLFPIIQALRFSYLIFQKETRSLAKDWIEDNIPKLDLIVTERDHIRFTPLKEELQFQSNLEPGSLSRKDKFLLALDDEFYPKESRAILRLWAFSNIKNRYQFLKEQGVKYVIISKSSLGGTSKNNLESEIISSGGELIKGFSPFISENSLRQSVFPCEFINPLIDLWALKRLGPVFEIYRL